jgi:peroxiredoxin Q/BCP
VQLLSDAESEVCEAFGVWKEKSMYGKKFMGIERSTFLIDGEGRIAREWRKVKVPGHAEEVLEAVRAL